MKSTIGSTTTYFVGTYYEQAGSTVTKYYGIYPAQGGAGAQRIAMRTGSTLYYLLSDQLGSTSITTNTTGGKVAELRYDASPLRGCFAREGCAILLARPRPSTPTPGSTAM